MLDEPGSAMTSIFSDVTGFLFRLEFVQVVVETAVALLREAPIRTNPRSGLLQPLAIQSTRSALRITTSRYEPGTLEHFEMLGDCRLTQLKRLRELQHRRIPFGEAREDGPPCWISGGRKCGVQVVAGVGALSHI